MQSAIYSARLLHSRSEPRSHAFRYRMRLVYIDLQELPRLFAGRAFWSIDRFNLGVFRRADYLGRKEQPLREAVLDLVETQLGRRPSGRVAILTQLRTFGYLFNPVSFYFVRDTTGKLEAIVAEITNTPWSERHAYVLDAAGMSEEQLEFVFDKDFHVSPFFGLNQTYQWCFKLSEEELSVSMTNFEQGRAVFRSELHGKRRSLTSRSLAALLAFAPLQPLRLHLAIYWQAALLYLKRMPFFTHPRKRLPVQDARQS